MDGCHFKGKIRVAREKKPYKGICEYIFSYSQEDIVFGSAFVPKKGKIELYSSREVRLLPSIVK